MKKLILLVEDNKRLKKNLLFMLQMRGFETIGAENGKEALAIVKEHRPDLIISDVMMPDMNGHDLLVALRTLGTTLTIPLIFLTAKGNMIDIRFGMMLGADDYLVKPVDLEELVKVINTRLIQHERQKLLLAAQTESVQRHLLAVLPHELRTPLSGIIGAATLIQSEIATLTKAEIVELNDCVLSSSRRLARITENFLLYAHIRLLLENPAFVPIIADFPLVGVQHLLHEVILSVAEGCSRINDVEVVLFDAVLGVTQRHIERAVSEICLNAFAFSPMDTTVRVTSRTLGSLYVIDILNEGRGMNEEQIQLVKQSLSTFVQFDRSSFEQQGTGLGLTLTRSIVALYDGYFDIVSDSTQTTVSIGFPYHKS